MTSVRKSERLLNLLIMLLVQRRYVAKDRIREILYPGQSVDAFEKMFERDKEELRSLGVPIEVGSLDPYFDDEPGYRVRPDEFALPEVSLAADEAAVLALAAKVWEHASLADMTTGAIRKLAAAGVPVDEARLELVSPRLSADEPSFDVFWEATHTHTAVEFAYRRASQPVALRHLQPWGVVRYSGRWYAVGLDTDRGQERVFRLSRVEGEPRLVGPPGAFEIPDGTDVREVARRLAPRRPDPVPAEVLVRTGAGVGLRRKASTVETGVSGPDEETGWDRLTLADDGLADEILTYGADAYVVAPEQLRTEIVERLTRAVEAAS